MLSGLYRQPDGNPHNDRKHWHEEMPFTADNSLAELIFTENSLFFDIETTGFSAARTSLYLIGCAARKENLLIVDQFFAETPAD